MLNSAHAISRSLLAGLAFSCLFAACSQQNVQPTASTTRRLLPAEATSAPTLFLTVTSRTRSTQELEEVVRSTVLPGLEQAGITDATGPRWGVTQFWIQLAPDDLEHLEMDVDGALAALATAVEGTVGPVPGRHGLAAWAIYRPQSVKLIDLQQTYLTSPDGSYTPLYALGHTQFSRAPIAWSEQPNVTFLLHVEESMQGLTMQRFEDALHTATDGIADDLEIVMGRTGGELADAPEVYVTVGPPRYDNSAAADHTCPSNSF